MKRVPSGVNVPAPSIVIAPAASPVKGDQAVSSSTRGDSRDYTSSKPAVAGSKPGVVKSTGKKKTKKKGSVVSRLIFLLILTVGLGIMAYPWVSDYIQAMAHKSAIGSYQEVVNSIDGQTYEEIIAEATDYNEYLAEHQLTATTLLPELEERYYQTLDVTGTGMMGYITIDKINVHLPIYHGTSDAVLEIGTGHLEGTSFPIGGIPSHSVLSAHTGLPSAKLFTDADQLEIGDEFSVTILNETKTYKVDDIKVVLPEETTNLVIEPQASYVTLMTCTPYGINSHRLLVRASEQPSGPAAAALHDFKLEFLVEGILIPIVVVVGVIALITFMVIRRRLKKRSTVSSPQGAKKKG